jgi:BON domain
MLRKQVVPDKVLLKQVNQRLMRAGLGASCSVRVSVKSGQVTLSGTIQRDLQRRPALRAASGIAGVRQVVDQLKIAPKEVRAAPKQVKVEYKPPDGKVKNLYARPSTEGSELS